jgi:hypothetical protein
MQANKCNASPAFLLYVILILKDGERDCIAGLAE